MSPQRTPSRPFRGAALALLLALPLTACGSSEDPEPAGPRPVLAQPSQPGVASGVGQSGERRISLIVTKGRVSGVSETVELPLNTPVRLTVTADVADVLVVEGYDARAQLTVNEPVQLSFITSRAGEFTVSLAGSDRVLTRLRVQ
jgi:hypothetical protein